MKGNNMPEQQQNTPQSQKQKPPLPEGSPKTQKEKNPQKVGIKNEDDVSSCGTGSCD
jgi:hypothetical protein